MQFMIQLNTVTQEDFLRYDIIDQPVLCIEAFHTGWFGNCLTGHRPLQIVKAEENELQVQNPLNDPHTEGV